MALKDSLHNLKEKYKGTWMAPVFGSFHTFIYTPNETTHSGGHIRGADDLKRTMTMVIIALLPVLFFGMYNTGYQHHLSTGEVEMVSNGFFSAEFWSASNFWIGFWKILPLISIDFDVIKVVALSITWTVYIRRCFKS